MKIGFIGLGAMGAPMAANLIKAGHDVTVHNRTRSKEEPLVELGARAAASPAKAAAGAEMVISIVSDTQDVEEVLFGSEGVSQSVGAGGLVIDMSTIDPSASRSFAERLRQEGADMLDAPVSGGTEGASGGTLSIMVGGKKDSFERALPILETLGSKITHIGDSGAGQLTKAINQVIIAGVFHAVAEGMVLGLRAHLDMTKVIDALGAGAASSWVLTNRAPRMLEHRYPLGFKLSLHRKDLRIALDAAEGLGFEMHGAEMVAKIEDRLISAGYGDEDMSVIARAVEGL